MDDDPLSYLVGAFFGLLGLIFWVCFFGGMIWAIFDWSISLFIAYWLPVSISVGAVVLLFGWGLLKAIQNKSVCIYLGYILCGTYSFCVLLGFFIMIDI